MSLTYHVYIPQNLTKARFLTRKMSIIRFCSSSLDTHSSSMSVFVAYCHYRGREHATSLPFFPYSHLLVHPNSRCQEFLSSCICDNLNLHQRSLFSERSNLSPSNHVSKAPFHRQIPKSRRGNLPAHKYLLDKAGPPTLPRSHRLRETA
jgi:hypothetical protein